MSKVLIVGFIMWAIGSLWLAALGEGKLLWPVTFLLIGFYFIDDTK